MTTHFLKSAALSVAMLLCTASVPALALDVGATVGSGANATTSATSGNTGASVSVGSGGGPLATATSSDDGSQTDAAVNLGSLLDGLDLSGIGLPGSDGSDGTDGNGGNAGAGGGYQAIANSLSAADRQRLALRCQTVLFDPTVYKPDVVEFCRMIVKLKM